MASGSRRIVRKTFGGGEWLAQTDTKQSGWNFRLLAIVCGPLSVSLHRWQCCGFVSDVGWVDIL